MGLFKNIFGTSDITNARTIPWKTLNTIDQLDIITNLSNSKTQIIFKHSTRCGISRMVLNHFETNYTLSENDADLYYLDLLSYRDVSNEVGYRFQVLHQSPQLLVIRNGIAVEHASHGDINTIDLNRII